MLVQDAGSVMVDKVRFCRWRILRRAGTAFASTCSHRLEVSETAKKGRLCARGSRPDGQQVSSRICDARPPQTCKQRGWFQTESTETS